MYNNKEQLDQVHPDYAANIQRWRLYRDSYMGGLQFRNGEYLFRYQLESAGEYQNRLDETPLENHCRRTVDSYSSFIFGATIERDYGSIANNPNLEPFLKDADMDGRSFRSFLIEAGKWSSVYGSAWIFVDKPATNVNTRADELGQGIRPYVSLVSPENVVDWKYVRQPNGSQVLEYVKVLEEKTKEYYIYKIYTREETMRVKSFKEDDEYYVLETQPNAIGEVPAIVLYNNRSWTPGIGISDICDIADIQRSIYTDYSEITQLIKLSNHPTLVKPSSVDVTAGAGGIINLPDDGFTSDLRPYLLTPSGQNIATIIDTINRKVEAIDKMTHLDSVSGQRSARSGVAMLIEQKALASLLADKASSLQLAEEQIWRLWCQWLGTAWDGEIYYPDSFDTRDRQQDLMNLKIAQEIGVSDPKLKQYMEMAIASAIVDDETALEQINESIMSDKFVPHTMYDAQGNQYQANTQQEHEQYEALGYTHEQPVVSDDTNAE
jgi:hypothetical protein